MFKIPEPVINAHAGGIQIVFNKKYIINEDINEEINEDINGDINEDINAVFILIKNNGGIKAKNIAKGVMKPKKTIDRYLKKLKDIGKIEYRGSNKTGGYYTTNRT